MARACDVVQVAVCVRVCVRRRTEGRGIWSEGEEGRLGAHRKRCAFQSCTLKAILFP